MHTLHGFVLLLIFEMNRINTSSSQSQSESFCTKLLTNCSQQLRQCYQEKYQQSDQYYQKLSQYQTKNNFLTISYTMFNTTIDHLKEDNSRLKFDILLLIAPLVAKEKIGGLRTIVFTEVEIVKQWLTFIEDEKKSKQKPTTGMTPTPQIILTPKMRNTAEKLENAVKELRDQREEDWVEFAIYNVLFQYCVPDRKQERLKERISEEVTNWFIAFEISKKEGFQKLRNQTNCDILLLSIHLAYLHETASDDALSLGMTLAQQMQFSDSEIVDVLMKKTKGGRDKCLRGLLTYFFPDPAPEKST